ncbi:MAG: hypothetical protein Kow0090_06400 [Myxococcota bacterium]
MRNKIYIKLILTVALVILFAASALAFDLIRSGSTPVRWSNSSMPVPYVINSSGSADITDGSDKKAVQASFDTWQNVTCSYLTFKYNGETDSRSASMYDNRNIITWIESAWPADMGSQTIGVTTPAFGYNGLISDADIRFNGQNYCWSTTGSYRCMDVANIATHEIGHFCGLGHEPAIFDATMYPAGSEGEVIRATLHQDDINGLCFLYPSYDGSIGSPCDASHPCSGNNICASHGERTVCSKPCSSDSSCSSGFTCSSGACVPKSNVGGASGGGSGGGGTTGDGSLCSSCNDGSDCNSGICVQGPSLTICTQLCDANQQNCPSGYQCYPTQTGEGVCYPADGQCPPGGGGGGGGGGGSGGGKGDYCGDTGYCQSGLVCVGTSYDDAVCHTICQSNNDCATGEQCYDLQDQNGNLLGYGACVYVGGGGSDGGTPTDDDDDDSVSNDGGTTSLPGLNEGCSGKCSGTLVCVTVKGKKYCKIQCDPARKLCSDGSYCELSPEGYGYCGDESAPTSDDDDNDDDARSDDDDGEESDAGGGGGGSGAEMPWLKDNQGGGGDNPVESNDDDDTGLTEPTSCGCRVR